MPLPGAWIDRLFGRLTLRYGAAFLRQWPDLDIEAVKADWAEVLDGTTPESIGYALRFLPLDRPPNAMQFRDQCRRAPQYLPPALPAPDIDPQRVAAARAKIAEVRAKLVAKAAIAEAAQ